MRTFQDFSECISLSSHIILPRNILISFLWQESPPACDVCCRGGRGTPVLFPAGGEERVGDTSVLVLAGEGDPPCPDSGPCWGWEGRAVPSVLSWPGRGEGGRYPCPSPGWGRRGGGTHCPSLGWGGEGYHCPGTWLGYPHPIPFPTLRKGPGTRDQGVPHLPPPPLVNKMKTLPSRHNTYAGSKNAFRRDAKCYSVGSGVKL